MKKYPLIIIEGPDGSGKTTLTETLRKRLEALGHDVSASRQPGGTSIGEALRDLLKSPELDITPLTQAYLFYASRVESLERILLPTIEHGGICIVDRFELSTLFYQVAIEYAELATKYSNIAERNLHMFKFKKHMERLNALSMSDITVKYIILDASDEVLNSRREGGNDRFESRDADFQKHIRTQYRTWVEDFEDRIPAEDSLYTLDTEHPLSDLDLDRLVKFVTE